MSIEAIYNKKVTPEMLAHLTALVDECKEEAEKMEDRYLKVHLRINKRIAEMKDPDKKVASLATILDVVCEQRQFTYDQVRDKSKKGELALTRQIFMYLSRKYCSRSLGQIGRFINRDHTTVLYSIKSVENWITTDREICALVKGIETKLLEQIGELETTRRKVSFSGSEEAA